MIGIQPSLSAATVNVRYNVVAVDGLFGGDGKTLKVRIADNGPNAQVVVRLYQMNITLRQSAPRRGPFPLRALRPRAATPMRWPQKVSNVVLSRFSSASLEPRAETRPDRLFRTLSCQNKAVKLAASAGEK